MGPREILAVAALLGTLVVLAGCWQLMRSLRTRPSRLLFASLICFVVWVFVADTITSAIIFYTDESKPAAWANWAAVSIEVFVPAFLILFGSACFWLVARSLPRPN
jgi:heme A synthase